MNRIVWCAITITLAAIHEKFARTSCSCWCQWKRNCWIKNFRTKIEVSWRTQYHEDNSSQFGNFSFKISVWCSLMDELLTSTVRKNKIRCVSLSDKSLCQALLTVVLGAYGLTEKHKSRTFVGNKIWQERISINHAREKICRLYRLDLHIFVKRKIQLLLATNIKILNLFTLVNPEATTEAVASSNTIAQNRFIDAVVLRHRRLSHRRLVRAKQAAPRCVV